MKLPVLMLQLIGKSERESSYLDVSLQIAFGQLVEAGYKSETCFSFHNFPDYDLSL